MHVLVPSESSLALNATCILVFVCIGCVFGGGGERETETEKEAKTEKDRDERKRALVHSLGTGPRCPSLCVGLHLLQWVWAGISHWQCVLVCVCFMSGCISVWMCVYAAGLGCVDYIWVSLSDFCSVCVCVCVCVCVFSSQHTGQCEFILESVWMLLCMNLPMQTGSLREHSYFLGFIFAFKWLIHD